RLDLSKLFITDLAGGMGADGLEYRDDIPILRARPNRAAVDEHGRPIQASHRHDATRNVLVATTDGNETIEALARNDRFDRIGDHLARDERVAHPRRAHRDAVGQRDGVEEDRLAA